MLIYVVSYHDLVVTAFKTRPQAIEWIKSRSLVAIELTENNYSITEVEVREETNVPNTK